MTCLCVGPFAFYQLVVLATTATASQVAPISFNPGSVKTLGCGKIVQKMQEFNVPQGDVSNGQIIF